VSFEVIAPAQVRKREPKRVRLSCTTSAQVSEAIEALLWQGIHGRTRAEVVERLICQALCQKVRQGLIRLEDLQEPRAEPPREQQ
jgi:hypothetical protein